MVAETAADSSSSNSNNASATSFCKDVPNLLSSFVDTFVDFSVSGFFLLPNQSPPLQSHLQTRIPSPDRLIALGNVHGDLDKTKKSLRLANLIDAYDKWIGGCATLVQVGDVLDRGGQEIKLLYFLEKLRREAARAGGSIITMNGNHEIMNIEGDFRYVTKEGLDECNHWAQWSSIGNKMKALCSGLRIPEDPFRGVPFSFRGVKAEWLQGFRSRIAALCNERKSLLTKSKSPITTSPGNHENSENTEPQLQTDVAKLYNQSRIIAKTLYICTQTTAHCTCQLISAPFSPERCV